jgi:hypothetical protein
MKLFVSLLQNLEILIPQQQVLGRILPFFIDHMLRKEYYYLQKLGYTVGNPLRKLSPQ